MAFLNRKILSKLISLFLVLTMVIFPTVPYTSYGYHYPYDQGHIPIKVHGLERSISVNLGLPFIRTSVDHGTAFDIAGAGIANPRSMIEAIKAAVSLATGQGLP